jgi:hypothetical protein
MEARQDRIVNSAVWRSTGSYGTNSCFARLLGAIKQTVKGKEMFRRAPIQTLTFAVFLGFAGLTMAACDKDGPLEKAGEDVDNAVDNAGDQLDKAGDKLDEAGHDAKRSLEDATD